MEIKLFKDNIICCSFESHKDLILSFSRVSDFYEAGNGLRSRFFTTEEFLEAHMGDDGQFTYFEDWGGFNINGETFSRFIYKFKDDFTSKEKKLVEAVLIATKRLDEYYVIGYLHADEETRQHEICHALYLTDKGYQKKVKRLIEELSDKKYKSLIKGLTDMEYTEDVVDDEINAYLSTTADNGWLEENFDCNTKKIKKPFQKLFNETINMI